MAKFTAVEKIHPFVAFHRRREFFEQFKTISDYSPFEIQLAKSLKVSLPGVKKEELDRIPPWWKPFHYEGCLTASTPDDFPGSEIQTHPVTCSIPTY